MSDIDTLSESIKKVGLLEPLVLNTKNQVISGNRRLEAIRNLGIEDVEVLIKEIPEDEEPLYIISHNSQRVKTLRELINEIKVLIPYYSKGRGFRSGDTRTFLSMYLYKNFIQ